MISQLTLTARHNPIPVALLFATLYDGLRTTLGSETAMCLFGCWPLAWAAGWCFGKALAMKATEPCPLMISPDVTAGFGAIIAGIILAISSFVAMRTGVGEQPFAMLVGFIGLAITGLHGLFKAEAN